MVDDRANNRQPDRDEGSAEEFALVAGAVVLTSAGASYGLVVVRVLLRQNDQRNRAATVDVDFKFSVNRRSGSRNG